LRAGHHSNHRRRQQKSTHCHAPIETPKRDVDHRLLTLTNRCHERAGTKQNGAGNSRAVNED